MKTYLPDVNVWLALSFESHVFHAAAKKWIAEVSEDLCSFCRLTQQGFLRIGTNPKAFGDEALSMLEAWRVYDAILSDSRFVFTPEPPEIETRWRVLTGTEAQSPQHWSDAYLAAFAICSGFELVTFDRGFHGYANLGWICLA